jgi:UDP-N-acetylmuramate dehydrogenase
MDERAGFPLAELTTLRLGGPAERLLEPGDENELIAAVREADAAGEPVLLIAGGSNLVIGDAGFAGTVVRIATRGIAAERVGGRVRMTVAAGEPWDELVARSVADGLAGIECLSGIPGSAGATPVQNVGAYGEELAAVAVAVRAWDRRARAIIEIPASACGFGYRTSAFKHDDRHLILSVVIELAEAGLGRPVSYAQLADRLGVGIGERVPVAEARAAVLALRREKGMVVDPADPDSVSAGSFFTNPVLDPEAALALEARVSERLGPDAGAPLWPQPDGRVKTSAAWLIERAGFGRGYGSGRAGVSSKHTLALVNRGGASTADLLAVAREIRDGVRAAFGVELVPEPKLVGVSL